MKSAPETRIVMKRGITLDDRVKYYPEEKQIIGGHTNWIYIHDKDYKWYACGSDPYVNSLHDAEKFIDEFLSEFDNVIEIIKYP